MSTITLIPARLGATRLPRKPLASLAGKPMITHVLRNALAADVGPVVVACGEREIAEAVEQAGGQAIVTTGDHASGTDRIAEALTRIDPDGRHSRVINLQGDLPLIDPDHVRQVADLLADPAHDIATLAVPRTDEEPRTNPNIVKAVIETEAGATHGRALYFTRAPAPSGDGPLFHHVGIYGYQRAALDAFIKAPVSVLERRERLEQLRALTLGLRIEVGLVPTPPLEVDTPDDLARAEQVLAEQRGHTG